MKTLKLFALVGIFSVLFNVEPTIASQQQPAFGEYQNYVVIGAFKFQRNATRFVRHANADLSLDARFEMNPNRNLYYVYVLSTNDREAAISEARRLRSESELSDTWVYSGALGKMLNATSSQIFSRGVDINPVTDQAIGEVSSSDAFSEKLPVDNTLNAASSSMPATTATSGPPLPATAAAETVSITTSAGHTTASLNEAAATAVPPNDGLEGKPFFFKLYRAADNQMVEGDVDAIDVDRSRKIASYKGNTSVKVSDPASKSDDISFVCEVFGYRKLQKDMNYTAPTGEGIEQNPQGVTVVPFELVRLQKGDIAVMYNVYFFKDGSIMRPESRYEVTSLLDMLNENKNYKIRIHGHTNGGAPGKIISMSKESTNYFALTDTKDGYGSAKQLSEERAIIIRNYLVSNGIDASRMQVKAWGGKRPIHDKMSSRAQENVRVEIEILED